MRNVIEVAGDVVCRTVNGKCEIKSDDTVAEKPFYLMVNGVLNIGPDTQKQLARCAGMTVNGSLVCPESVYATLSGVTVNGSSVPATADGAIVLKRNAVIDPAAPPAGQKQTVLGRQAEWAWWTRNWTGRPCAGKASPSVPREVMIAQSKVEALLDLTDEKAEITIVPDRHCRGAG